MLKTVNTPAFGATYGISVVKLGEEGKKAQASLEPAIQYIKETTMERKSEITNTIDIKDGVILIAREVKFLIESIKQRLREQHIPETSLEPMVNEQLEREAYTKIVVNS